eukprot:JP438695.1.p2 GENE.JP438695.1~~JP438695.1.p2  ORF type:complete len:112 (+),score=11.32 JP438695.1:78-413(+)
MGRAAKCVETYAFLRSFFILFLYLCFFIFFFLFLKVLSACSVSETDAGGATMPNAGFASKGTGTLDETLRFNLSDRHTPDVRGTRFDSKGEADVDEKPKGATKGNELPKEF